MKATIQSKLEDRTKYEIVLSNHEGSIYITHQGKVVGRLEAQTMWGPDDTKKFDNTPGFFLCFIPTAADCGKNIADVFHEKIHT